ncbi:MAG TPA: methyltransferase domain-containing protein [Steroidobacteraceae bacterium]|nr:methyltransferase domain-containing protein [Steroidobacteraceae bacterium]
MAAPEAVHASAAKGFARDAEAYARGRPEYPVALDPWLRTTLGLGPARTVLDLGAGTGKLTRRLLATDAAVVAVEPVPEMLARLRESFPQVEARSGTAQAIPLADATVDAVTCGQSFHWFATATALREIHRVLRPGGHLGLVWNMRDESEAWSVALTRILTRYEGDAPRFRSGAWRKLFPATGFGALREQRFAHRHSGPAEQVIVDRVLSVSFIAALEPSERARVAAQLRELISSTPSLSASPTVHVAYQTLAVSCVRD